MNPIRTNKPVFFGNDGDVLKSGQIYIGQPNQWPISFPKTVTFQDSSGAQFEAQQPLRTNDQGQISFNGKAIIALVDGNYSLLVQDRNGVQVQDGYTPFVSNPGPAESNLGDVTRVGLLLTDIKSFDVTPGDTVRNVGKTVATDGLGADWLVVSNTGNPADDVDLIDFANGTQGQRIENNLYDKDYDIAPDVASGAFDPGNATSVWTGSSTSVALADLSESGQGFYLVEYSQTDIGGPFLTAIFVVPGMDNRITGRNSIEFGANEIHRWAEVGTVSDELYATIYERDYTGNTANIFSGTITEIWKV